MLCKQKPELCVLVSYLILYILCIGINIPVIPKLAMEFFPGPNGHDAARATYFTGVLLGAKAVAEFLSMPVLVGLSDTYGRKPVLIFSALVVTITYGVLLASPTKAVLIATVLLQGMCDASIDLTVSAITDVSSPEMVTKNIGLVGVAFGLGFIVGPASGGAAIAYASKP